MASNYVWKYIPMNKSRAGFSYLEILIALALFAIVLVAVLPTLLQAGRNMGYAESYYRGHLTAQELMLAVRGALIDGNDIEYAAFDLAQLRDISYYRVWLSGVNHAEIYAPGAPIAAIDLQNELVPLTGHNTVIIVAVWNSDKNLIGRAFGVVNHYLEGA